MGLFRRKVTEDTDLTKVSTGKLLKEHRRLWLEATDPAGGPKPSSFRLPWAVEEELDRRRVGYRTAKRSSKTSLRTGERWSALAEATELFGATAIS